MHTYTGTWFVSTLFLFVIRNSVSSSGDESNTAERCNLNSNNTAAVQYHRKNWVFYAGYARMVSAAVRALEIMELQQCTDDERLRHYIRFFS